MRAERHPTGNRCATRALSHPLPHSPLRVDTVRSSDYARQSVRLAARVAITRISKSSPIGGDAQRCKGDLDLQPAASCVCFDLHPRESHSRDQRTTP